MRTSTLRRIAASVDAQKLLPNDESLAKKIYSQTMGIKYSVLGRYKKHGVECPSELWAINYLETGGSFDSCGVWGISPVDAKNYEDSGIEPEYIAHVYKLIGRADNFCSEDVFKMHDLGFYPETRAEYYAITRGIFRREWAENAGIENLKSVLRYGWMKEKKFEEYILRFSKKIITNYTNTSAFNGVCVPGWKDFSFSETGKVFKNWLKKRTPQGVREKVRADRRVSEIARTERLKPLGKIIPKLFAASCRAGLYYQTSVPLETAWTSVYDIGSFQGENFVTHLEWQKKKTKNYKFLSIKGRSDIAYVRIKNVFFVFNPQEGFKNHIEGKNLEDTIYLWEKKRGLENLVHYA